MGTKSKFVFQKTLSIVKTALTLEEKAEPALPNNESYAFHQGIWFVNDKWRKSKDFVHILSSCGISCSKGNLVLVHKAALDVAIDFIQACTCFKGLELACPSEIVLTFLNEWEKRKSESYYSLMKELNLCEFLPHKMKRPDFQSTTSASKYAMARTWVASCLVEGCNPDEIQFVPNIFALDSDFYGVKGAINYAIGKNPHGLIYECSKGVWNPVAGTEDVSVELQSADVKELSRSERRGSARIFESNSFSEGLLAPRVPAQMFHTEECPPSPSYGSSLSTLDSWRWGGDR